MALSLYHSSHVINMLIWFRQRKIFFFILSSPRGRASTHRKKIVREQNQFRQLKRKKLRKKNNFIAFKISQLTPNEEINWWERGERRRWIKSTLFHSPPNINGKLKNHKLSKIQSKYTHRAVYRRKVKLNSFISVSLPVAFIKIYNLI